MALRVLTKTAFTAMQSQAARLNAFTSVQSLPLHIFTEIIRLSLTLILEDCYPRLIELATVSHYWADVIRTSSVLWATVYCCSWTAVEHARQRSKASPLSVIMLCKHAEEHATWAADSKRAQLFCQQSSRWRIATVWAGSWKLFKDALSLNSLEHLIVEGKLERGACFTDEHNRRH